MNEINIKSKNLCTKNTSPLLLEEVIPVQGYIDKRSWGIYPSIFCHPLLTIPVIPFMLSGCMGYGVIDIERQQKAFDKRLSAVPITYIENRALTEEEMAIALHF